MDYTHTNLPEKRSWRLDARSFALGLTLAVLPISLTASAAGGFDLGNIGNIGKVITDNVKSLVGIKKNLYGDKDKLLTIKNQLFTLATETRKQIDGINALVGEVEGHIKSTQAHITDTSSHVNEIDNVRASLTGAKK